MFVLKCQTISRKFCKLTMMMIPNCLQTKWNVNEDWTWY